MCGGFGGGACALPGNPAVTSWFTGDAQPLSLPGRATLAPLRQLARLSHGARDASRRTRAWPRHSPSHSACYSPKLTPYCSPVIPSPPYSLGRHDLFFSLELRKVGSGDAQGLAFLSSARGLPQTSHPGLPASPRSAQDVGVRRLVNQAVHLSLLRKPPLRLLGTEAVVPASSGHGDVVGKGRHRLVAQA